MKTLKILFRGSMSVTNFYWSIWSILIMTAAVMTIAKADFPTFL